jgi:hypothetical protein
MNSIYIDEPRGLEQKYTKQLRHIMLPPRFTSDSPRGESANSAERGARLVNRMQIVRLTVIKYLPPFSSLAGRGGLLTIFGGLWAMAFPDSPDC